MARLHSQLWIKLLSVHTKYSHMALSVLQFPVCKMRGWNSLPNMHRALDSLPPRTTQTRHGGVCLSSQHSSQRQANKASLSYIVRLKLAWAT